MHVLGEEKNWKQCGHLDGKEAVRIESHFLFWMSMPLTRMGNIGG